MKHTKLKRWFQVGGHFEEVDDSLIEACKREVIEKCGIKLFTDEAFLIDLDIHKIPNHSGTKEHLHYDMTLCFLLDTKLPLVQSSESLELVWISLNKVSTLTSDAAILRMVDKTHIFLKRYSIQHTI